MTQFKNNRDMSSTAVEGTGSTVRNAFETLLVLCQTDKAGSV